MTTVHHRDPDMSRRTVLHGPATDPVMRAKILGVLAVSLLDHGTIDDFATIIAPQAVNRPGGYAPAACRATGPGAVYATSMWLRRTFSDLKWTIRALSADESRVAVRADMTGRHTSDLVLHGDDGLPCRTLRASHLRFTVTRTYRFRIADARIIERSVDFGELGPE
ncbi:ester cyclase [Nocardia noduli]|uniref:ester cyclase n=1 Tax=Nocardia noduli TaxID=2815722 RepID=UPI001C242A8A|nr:ester cyclase [Nocardia noduli]